MFFAGAVLLCYIPHRHLMWRFLFSDFCLGLFYGSGLVRIRIKELFSVLLARQQNIYRQGSLVYWSMKRECYF